MRKRKEGRIVIATSSYLYLCLVIAAGAVFGGVLAWGDWYSHRR